MKPCDTSNFILSIPFIGFLGTQHGVPVACKAFNSIYWIRKYVNKFAKLGILELSIPFIGFIKLIRELTIDEARKLLSIPFIGFTTGF